MIQEMGPQYLQYNRQQMTHYDMCSLTPPMLQAGGQMCMHSGSTAQNRTASPSARATSQGTPCKCLWKHSRAQHRLTGVQHRKKAEKQGKRKKTDLSCRTWPLRPVVTVVLTTVGPAPWAARWAASRPASRAELSISARRSFFSFCGRAGRGSGALQVLV